MICETGHHSWRPVVIPGWVLLDFLSEGAWGPTEVVVHDTQPGHCHMKHQLLGERVHLAGLTGVEMPLCPMQTLHVAGVDRRRRRTCGQRLLHLFLGSQADTFLDRHDPAFFPHLRDRGICNLHWKVHRWQYLPT